MADIKSQLQQFSEIASDPRKQMHKYLDAGKKVMGVVPYYAPEELVYAAGAIPFGVWGRVGESEEARKYFPPFYCSIAQMTLEMGLKHELDDLSAILIPATCDTLRGLVSNWKAGVGNHVPVLLVSYPQNRFTEVGVKYCKESYEELADNIGRAAGHVIENEEVYAAIELYNKWRHEMRRFLDLAGKRPALVKPSERCAVINAGYYMDKAEHLKMLKDLDDALEAEPENIKGYHPIVLSGIYEDIPALLKTLDEDKYAIVADDMAKESRNVATDVPTSGDNPYGCLAEAFCSRGNDSLLFDPRKKHLDHVVDIAKKNGAKGVVLFLAKFCDPEEFDAPLLSDTVRKAGLEFVNVEIDQSTETYGQAQTQLETFADLL